MYSTHSNQKLNSMQYIHIYYVLQIKNRLHKASGFWSQRAMSALEVNCKHSTKGVWINDTFAGHWEFYKEAELGFYA